MTRFRFMTFLLALFMVIAIGLIVTPEPAEAGLYEASVWGYIRVNGVLVTQYNAQNLTGRYPVLMEFKRYSYDNPISSYQYLTGSGSIYYAQLPLQGTYRIRVYVRGVWRTCQSSVWIGANSYINCNVST